MTADVTVVTPAVPGRPFLARCVEAAGLQTVKPAEHLVGLDHARTGHGARIRNRLTRAADTTWIAYCDDDDFFLPRHIELLLGAVEPLTDVVVSLYELSTNEWHPQHECDPAGFLTHNWVHPSSTLIRRDAVLAVGGFPDPQPPMWDDWALLIALHRAGARFACVHEVTNIKGIHPDAICWGAGA